jgi:hypothetical protein
VGQTTAGCCGGGGGGGGGAVLASTSELLGPGKVESVSGLALTACTLLINFRPDDKIISRVRELIKRARFTRAEIANAMANPYTDSSSLPLAPKSSAHCIKIKNLFHFC